MNMTIESVSAHVKAAWGLGVALAFVAPGAFVLYAVTPSTSAAVHWLLLLVAAVSGCFWRWCYRKGEAAIAMSEQLLRSAIVLRASGEVQDVIAGSLLYATGAEDAWQGATVWQRWAGLAAALTGGCVAVGVGYLLLHI